MPNPWQTDFSEHSIFSLQPEPLYSETHYHALSLSKSCEVKSKSLSSVRLFMNPWTIQSSGFLQARILEWVAFLFSRGPSQPKDRTQVSHIAGRFFFTSWATREAQARAVMLPNYPFVLPQASLPTWPPQPSTLTPLGGLEGSSLKHTSSLSYRWAWDIGLFYSCVCMLSRVWLFCDPMDWSLPGSFCSWDAQIPQIKVVGCWGVESPPSSAHTHGAQCVGVGCFTPSLALCQLFFLARRPLVKRGWGGYVCVCVCVCTMNSSGSCHLQSPVELHMGKKYPLTVWSTLLSFYSVLSCFQLFATPWIRPISLLCPWDFSGQNTGVGCHFLFQGIFPAQGSNPHLLRLLHLQVDSLPLSQSLEKTKSKVLATTFSPVVWIRQGMTYLLYELLGPTLPRIWRGGICCPKFHIIMQCSSGRLLETGSLNTLSSLLLAHKYL